VFIAQILKRGSDGSLSLVNVYEAAGRVSGVPRYRLNKKKKRKIKIKKNGAPEPPD
jgi:hypothetical protein